MRHCWLRLRAIASGLGQLPRARGSAQDHGSNGLALREQEDARSCERSPRLVRASRFLLAGGVLLVGLIAALPFRQTAQPLPAPSLVAAPIELTLRRPDLPLQLAARSDARQPSASNR